MNKVLNKVKLFRRKTLERLTTIETTYLLCSIFRFKQITVHFLDKCKRGTYVRTYVHVCAKDVNFSE